MSANPWHEHLALQRGLELVGAPRTKRRPGFWVGLFHGLWIGATLVILAIPAIVRWLP